MLLSSGFFIKACKPMAPTIAFYTSILGFSVGYESDDHTILHHAASNSTLHLILPDDPSESHDAEQVRFEVSDVDEIKRQCEGSDEFRAWIHPAVVKRGGNVVESAWGTREFTCMDPRSNVCVQVFSSIK
ncbi:hypothetical protein BC830DRAFT_1158711 [Chytriomyces sp. MP71]|nr:hypothetical protein BC830DRAFT_1158711 [Chytriomyces sp. MP71]